MDEFSRSNESKETISSQKLFGLPRTVSGALIGLFSFLLVDAIFWSTNLFTAVIILLSPGIFMGWIIIPPDIAWSTSTTSRIISYSIIFGVAAIPPAFLGALITSKDKQTN